MCQEAHTEHRLIPPRHPQTNGMVERFNGRIAEILRSERFYSSADLKQTLENYQWAYNHQIPQRALGHVSPIQALKEWQKKRPDLFVKRVYNVAGLDTYDNGKEFAYHMEIAKVLKADGYFAHHYHSWERGLNENTNGLIRKYQPKGTDFNKLTDKQVLEIMDKLNNRPRKCLGYKTPKSGILRDQLTRFTSELNPRYNKRKD